MTIYRKGLLLIGLPIAFQLLLLGYLLHLQADASDADRWALHTKDVMVQTEEVYRLTTETLSQTRAAIVTGNADFTPELAQADKRILPAIDDLEALVSDNPLQAMQIRGFRATAVELLRRVNSELELVRSGKMTAAAAIVASFKAERQIEELRDERESIMSSEQRLYRERVARLAAVRRQGYWFVAIAALVTLGLAGFVLWAFTSGIALRLSELAKNADRLAEGRPLTRIAAGTDEIGKVDQAFVSAAARLRTAEEAEKSHRAELERRAADLAATNAELARANSDLQFKRQEIETFVHSVSHDLRSPLVNLQGFGKELAHACQELRAQATAPEVPAAASSRMTALIDSDMRESLHFIQTAVSRSGTIIDALLRLSRAGRVEYRRQRVDIGAVVTRVIDAMQSKLREKKAQIVVRPLPDAEADPAAAEQIFANLIGNAVNYLDPGRPGQIEIGVRDSVDGDGRQVRYYVRDNGVGIPAAYLPKMFVAFQRLHAQMAVGEGVGLAMVHRVVERLGGSVSVESIEGEGSTFLVSLPAIAKEPCA